MIQKGKTKEELIEQIKLLQKRMAELETVDIESKQQQQQQQQQQQIRRLAIVVRDSNDAITIQDFEGKIISWNYGAELMYGYNEQEALKMSIDLLTHPEKVAEQAEFTRRLIAGEKITSFETTRVTKDGRILDVWLTVTKIVDDTGKPVGIATTERNITERRQAEKALRESEARYKALFFSAVEGIVVADLETKQFLYANPAICRMFGYTEEELMRLGVEDIHPKESLAHVLAEFEAQVRGKKTLAPNLLCLRKDGISFYADVNATSVVLDGRKCIVGFFTDITERKKMEAARDTILKWQKDVASLNQALLAPDLLESKLKVVTDSIVRIFNVDFCRIWLIQPGDLCEKGCIHAEVKEEPHICHFRDKCLHLMASSGRYTHIDGKVHARVPFGCYKIGLVASGEEHKFLTNDAVNDPRVHNHEWARGLGLVSFAGYQLKIPGGETIGVLALFAKHPILAAEDAMLDNISTTIAFLVKQAEASQELETQAQKLKQNFEELKKSQNMLIQSEKLASLGRITAEIAHQVNNPLMIISSNAQLSLMSGSGSAESKDVLELIVKECKRASDIMHKVMKFAQPSKDKITEMYVRDVIEEIVSLIEQQFNMAHIDIKRNYPEKPIPISIDSQLMQEAFMNILNNAKEAMPDGGTITITISLEGDFLRIDFKDTGCGMSEEAKQKIFEPFFTTKEKGTGLGLPICYGIIKAHGGELIFESQLNKGFTATVLLPSKRGGG